MTSLDLISPVCFLAAAGACLAMYAGARLLAVVPTRRLTCAALIAAALFGLFVAARYSNLVLSDFLVAGIGLIGGVLIGRQISSPGVLALAVACAAGADCLSFLFGPTHFAMRQMAGVGGSPLMAYLSISVPIDTRLYSVIGLGDLWIFTACVASTRRLGWSERTALVVPLVGILAAVAAALWLGPLPALPFLAASVLGYLGLARRRRELGRERV